MVDIHADTAAIAYMRTGQLHARNTPAMTKRILRRSRNYAVTVSTKERTAGQVVVLRRMADGTTRVVPPAGERPGIVESAHLASGHFGIRRTTHLLLINYWWAGILRAAQEVVSRYEVCQRVKATFNTQPLELHSLPIEGLFYRRHSVVTDMWQS